MQLKNKDWYRDPHSGGLVFYGQTDEKNEYLDLKERYNQLKKKNKGLEDKLNGVLDRLEKLEAKEG